MKKKNPNKTADKSIFQSAGEVIGAIGHGIVAGKDKVAELAHSVADTFSEGEKVVIKNAKKAGKAVRKAIPIKAAAKKGVKKVAKKASRKTKKVAKKVTTKTKKAAKTIQKKATKKK